MSPTFCTFGSRRFPDALSLQLLSNSIHAALSCYRVVWPEGATEASRLIPPADADTQRVCVGEYSTPLVRGCNLCVSAACLHTLADKGPLSWVALA